jgi:carnitine 3-dehydrogenase
VKCERLENLIDSVHAEVGSRSVEELEEKRDELLLGVLALPNRRREPEPARQASAGARCSPRPHKNRN